MLCTGCIGGKNTFSVRSQHFDLGHFIDSDRDSGPILL